MFKTASPYETENLWDFFTKIGNMKITGILDQLDKILKIDKNNLVPVLRLGRPSNQRLE